MDKQTEIVILKSLNQILYTVDELRHQVPVYGREEGLEKARQEVYAELRRLELEREK